MEVDETAGPVTVQHLAHALEGHAVESDIIQIQAVDFHVLQQPGQPFHIVVIPAGGPTHGDRGIRGSVGQEREPPGGIVRHQVFAQPSEPAPPAIGQNLMPQAPQGPHFHGVVAQLPHGIVDLDFHLVFVPLLDELPHTVHGAERVIDVRVHFVGMMDVDDIGPGVEDVLIDLDRVMVALPEMGGGVEGFDRGDQKGEFKRQLLAGRHLSGAGEHLHESLVFALIPNRAAPLPLVPPSKRGGRPVFGYQRPVIAAAAQFAVKAGRDIADPETIVGAFPFPRVFFRAVSAHSTNAHRTYESNFRVHGD